MDDSEVENLLNKYKITRRELPKIRADDPAVIALGAKEGQVLEIIRKSKVAGESYYYRLVIKG